MCNIPLQMVFVVLEHCQDSLANGYRMGAMANIPLQMSIVLKTMTNILLQMDIALILCGQHSLAMGYCIGMANIILQMNIILKQRPTIYC